MDRGFRSVFFQGKINSSISIHGQIKYLKKPYVQQKMQNFKFGRNRRVFFHSRSTLKSDNCSW